MVRAKLQSYFILLCAAALSLLLIFLAALQYQWTGEASRTELDRARSGLSETLSLLEMSFDREINRVFFSFYQPPGYAPESQPGWRPELTRNLEKSWRNWESRAAYPGLVKRVLVAENSPGAPARLYWFNPSGKRLEATTWPDELQEFRMAFERQYSGNLGDDERRRWSDPGGLLFPPFYHIDEVPAFAGQVIVEPPQQSGAETGRQNRVRACLIICFDRQYILEQWIPSLTRRFLGANGREEFDFIVRSRRSPELILCHSPAADIPQTIAHPDAVVNIMKLQLDRDEGTKPEIERFIESTRHENELEACPEGYQNAGPRRPIPGKEGPEEGSENAVKYRLEMMQRAMEVMESQSWQILVKHRAGSIEAAVARTRTRNLILGFGILLLLAASLVMLTISTRRAQKLARQQMEFVAGISHELRTPIAVICSTAENLADGIVTSREQISHYGQYILREGRRLSRLVEQTLEFSGMRSGRRHFSLAPVDLASVVRQSMQACRLQAEEKRICIEHEMDSTLPEVMADEASLISALENLLSNAIKYSPPGSTVRITVSHSRVSETAEILVEDNGMGIEGNELKEIFEPFFRGSNAVRAQIRGAGIGLSIVKHIVEAHGGSITARSEVAKGSKFAISLPLMQAND